MSIDPFSLYRPKTDMSVQTKAAASETQQDPFSSYRPKQEEKQEEGLLSGAARQGGRTLSRIGESVLGAPRAFGEFLEGLVPEKALIKGAEKLGLGEGAKSLIETTKKYAPYKILPTSEDVRDVSKFLFGKKIEPQNEWEEKADEVVSDFAALALPLPGSKLKFLKPAILSLGSNIASDIVGRMGGTEKEKTYTKLGTIFLGSVINPKGAKKFGDELYAKARQARSPDSSVSAKNMQKKIKDMRTDLTKGDPDASYKSKSFNLLKNLESKIKNNDITVEELEKFKVDVNQARSGLYEEFKGNKPSRKLAKSNLDKVSKIIDDSLTEYGKKNPAWEAYYRPANEVYGSIAQSNKARNYISRNIGKISPHLTAGLFGIGHAPGGAAKTLTGLGASLAGGTATIESGALLARIYKSPTLRKYYYGVLQNAVKEDAVAMRENLRKLEEGLEKEGQSK